MPSKSIFAIYMETKMPKKTHRPALDQLQGVMLNESILGTDSGNGKCSSYSFDGIRYRIDTLPHLRIPVSGATFETDMMDNQTKIEYVDWQGERYGIGEGVWNIATRNQVQTHQNSERRYGD